VKTFSPVAFRTLIKPRNAVIISFLFSLK